MSTTKTKRKGGGDDGGDGSGDDMPYMSPAEEIAELDEMPKRPLESCEFTEIMRELQLRFPRFVFFAAYRKVDDQSESIYHIHGNHFEAMGMTHALMHCLSNELND